jgi:hypothetical protein
MTIPRPVTTALILSTALAPAVFAQAPTATQNTQRQPAQPAAPTRKSIVHHYPYPYPGYYHGDQTAGFRNPGGTGRYLEYYPAGNQFQVNTERDQVKVATFGGGGMPDRNEQLAAQQIGIQRYNAIQGHIDRMAQPYMGFGVGYFGGAY